MNEEGSSGVADLQALRRSEGLNALERAPHPAGAGVYSFADLVALRVVGQLRAAGVSVQTIRRAVKWLRSHADEPLGTLALAAQGKKVFALTDDPAKLIEATGEGQVVLAISVEKSRVTWSAASAR